MGFTAKSDKIPRKSGIGKNLYFFLQIGVPHVTILLRNRNSQRIGNVKLRDFSTGLPTLEFPDNDNN
jgi:hypothetical protein